MPDMSEITLRMTDMSEISRSGFASGSGSVADPMPELPQPNIIPYNDIVAKCANLPKTKALETLLTLPVRQHTIICVLYFTAISS